MAYRQEDELDAREYEMIYMLFHGPEDEEDARRQPNGQEPPCECPPPEDGIAVKILKFIFGERTIVEEDTDYKKPYHRHIHQPAQSTHQGSKRPTYYKRWTRKRLPQYAKLAEEEIAPPAPMGPGEALRAESMLRLIASVLCACALIIFSTTTTHLVRLKDWFMSG